MATLRTSIHKPNSGFWNKSFRLRIKESTQNYLLEEQREEVSIHCPFHMKSAVMRSEAQTNQSTCCLLCTCQKSWWEGRGLEKGRKWGNAWLHKETPQTRIRIKTSIRYQRLEETPVGYLEARIKEDKEQPEDFSRSPVETSSRIRDTKR